MTLRRNLQRQVPRLVILLVVAMGGPQGWADHERPHIVVILADDMGYADIGVHGCRDIPTPSIDSIAASMNSSASSAAGIIICHPHPRLPLVREQRSRRRLSKARAV